jgi:hypothetical protein
MTTAEIKDFIDSPFQRCGVISDPGFAKIAEIRKVLPDLPGAYTKTISQALAAYAALALPGENADSPQIQRHASNCFIRNPAISHTAPLSVIAFTIT